MRIAAVCIAVMAASAGSASAQTFGGYVTGGSGSIDYLVYREPIPQASVGALWRLSGDRVRIGGEVDVLTSNGYVSGRGGPFVELVPFAGARAVPFVRGGYFTGEDPSWIAGGGVDFRITSRGGIRVFVQDAFRKSSHPSPFAARDVFHEPSFQVGWFW